MLMAPASKYSKCTYKKITFLLTIVTGEISARTVLFIPGQLYTEMLLCTDVGTSICAPRKYDRKSLLIGYLIGGN